ncbi:hypothetical protein [Streptomyces chartreusis]|uniref:hypothetical protein n=1 Tax=Streptomyces chartreusis TaxID=1969 RepID=UPI001674C577|nr:hypothetical protein [Streptomyces chartreusis]GGX56056.1 hypothetical protein GCM10010321_86650 [Streptomyces chartreusis]
MSTTDSTDAPRFRLGEPDAECRHPVLLSDDQCLGHIFRWHGAWFAIAAGADAEIRIGDGRHGRALAPQRLVDEFDAGRITPLPLAQCSLTTSSPVGEPPLLHPRMPATDSNIKHAREVMAKLREYRWKPHGGYPGSDNPWLLECEFDGWKGVKYWSHLRERRNRLPSPFRHPGCISAEEVRARIPAYQK